MPFVPNELRQSLVTARRQFPLFIAGFQLRGLGLGGTLNSRVVSAHMSRQLARRTGHIDTMAFVVGDQFAIQGPMQLDPQQQLIVPLGCAPYERRVPIVQSEFP